MREHVEVTYYYFKKVYQKKTQIQVSKMESIITRLPSQSSENLSAQEAN